MFKRFRSLFITFAILGSLVILTGTRYGTPTSSTPSIVDDGTTITISSSIVPDVNDTLDIGTIALAIRNMYIEDDIVHQNDANTLISFGSDTIELDTDGKSGIFISMGEFDPAGVLINRDGDINGDFGVSTDTVAQAFFVDAGAETADFNVLLTATASISPVVDADANIFGVAGTLVEAASGTHANLDGIVFTLPSVTVGGASVTNATTVRITGAPSASGATNRALWVQAGLAAFDASVETISISLTNAANQILFDSDGTNVGTLTMAALSAGRTWTWPNATGTIAIQGSSSVALGAAAVTFVANNNLVVVTGDAGTNTIATITGGITGQQVAILFVDSLVTITDDDSHAADSVDLSAALTGADDTTLTLLYDGTSWYELSRSVN